VRGAEIGGFLIGKAEHRQRLTVWIDSIELAPTRYERGPSFRFEGDDPAAFAKPGAVGYFRSHTRKDLFLGPEDQQVIDQHFSKPENVFLLIKPFKTRPNLAGFFYSKDGKVDPVATPREFSFHRRELGGGEPQITAPEPAAPPAEPEEPELSLPAVEAGGLAEKPRPIVVWAMLAFLGFAATGSIAYLLFERTKNISAASRPSPSPLGLTAEENEHNIRLNWDRQSPSIRLSTRGTLEIREGTFQKSIDIDAEQLRNGSIIYSRPVAIADTVGFRLRLFFEQGQPLSESIQLVSNRPVLPIAALPVQSSPEPLPIEKPQVEQPKPAPPPKKEVAIRKASPPRVVKPPVSLTQAAARQPIQTPPDPAASASTPVAPKPGSKPETTPPEKKTDAVPVLTRPAPRRIP
jgi:hypothetical protein